MSADIHNFSSYIRLELICKSQFTVYLQINDKPLTQTDKSFFFRSDTGSQRHEKDQGPELYI